MIMYIVYRFTHVLSISGVQARFSYIFRIGEDALFALFWRIVDVHDLFSHIRKFGNCSGSCQYFGPYTPIVLGIAYRHPEGR